MNRRHAKRKMVGQPDACLEPQEHAGANPYTTFIGRLESFAWIPCLALMVVVPWPAVKVMTGFALLISLRTFNSLSRSHGITLLGGLFALAYLFSPYGLIAATTKNNTFGETIGQTAARIVVIGVLFVIGALWAYLAAGEIPAATGRTRKGRHLELIALAILALLLLAFNYAPLHNNVPIQGDESHHIARAWRLRRILRPLFEDGNAATAAIVFAMVVAFFFRPRRIAAHIKLFIVCAIGLIACVWTGFPGTPSYLEYLVMRYPLLSCWFHQLGPVWNADQFNEGMFRLIPMISAFAIGWFVLWALRKQGVGQVAAVVLALAFAMVPNIYFHCTILYLELPAVVLLTIAFYFIEPILKNDFESLRCCPGWYALMAVGFIKETSFVFIFGIIGLRFLVRTAILLKNRRLNGRAILHEVAAVFCIAAPLSVYLFLRMYFGEVRSYKAGYVNLTSAGLYVIAGKALWAQFGSMLVLAIGGLIVGLSRRRFVALVALILLFVSHSLFHFMDIHQIYIGLARFNLFLFAPLAVLAIWFLSWLAGKSRPALVGVGLMCLFVNVALSPIAITGEKKPTWASPNSIRHTEHYFPFEDAVRWLKTHRTNWPVLIGGSYYSSPATWYFAKANYPPRFSLIKLKWKMPYMDGLKKTITYAHKTGYPLVLWHKMEGGPTLTDEEKSILGYQTVKVFTNRYLSLVLYQTQSLPRQSAGKAKM